LPTEGKKEQQAMNFDRVIDRSGSYSIKWDNPKNGHGLSDIIPLWVADMDFAPPPAVIEAIRKRAEHPIFGYTRALRAYNEAVAAWYARRQDLELDPDDMLMAPAVMPALAAAIQAFTEKGEGVMILPPVYHPFYSVVEENGRVLVEAPLHRGGGAGDADGAWSMDFEGMRRAAAAAERAGIKLAAIIVSSPHNPVGRVWSDAELEELRDFARERDLALLCDEIHSDIVLGDRPFRSMARMAGEQARKLVVFSGPNKTFNIAGLHICQAVARDERTRAAMKRAISAWGFGLPNVFSLTAALAAYREGGGWLDELLLYLKGNCRLLSDFLSARLPGIGVSPVEGSYLAWLDLRALLERRGEGSDEKPLAQTLEEEGRVRLSPGSDFGKEGSGYLRLNFACPRSILAEALERMARTIEQG
jgi:cystathionine beta-lyase